MKKVAWGWKPVAILFVLIVVVGFAGAATNPGRASGFKWLEYASVAICAISLVQYAFGRPRVPRLFWRIFGPIFSLVLVAGLASAIGWLGTRLAIRPLSMTEQLGTATVIVLLLGYGFVILVPLYRLAEWKHLKGRAPDEGLASLTDTFA
jgi:hypothetical protein